MEAGFAGDAQGDARDSTLQLLKFRLRETLVQHVLLTTCSVHSLSFGLTS